MSTKKRILFIANEMSPYLELTDFAETVNKLAIKANESGMEVRCIMPRFGVINERRHRLHEVVRLSGINVTIDNDDYPLVIKVASLPNARLQIYFLDNEDFFKRKSIFHDEKENWFDDNGLRTVLFCKGALETVKKFGWPPDIIHCSGWMTGLIPMFIRNAYKKEPVFSNSKIVFTIGQQTFKEKLGNDFLKLATINDHITKKELEPFKDANNLAMFRGGATYADAITFGADKVDKKLQEQFAKVKGKKVIKYDEESDLTDYLQLYADLAK
ncbi:MAG TPA: glycogen/starch synthase [Ferruginibacter sp.]|jgi:starch synthase|nr:glycogen/starch synthase [Ferruginibacter sp.]MBN8700190.1 glycogen/starch synthase [Chitinophagales bacterium]HMX36179.1 glycogen/starch synthase [Ferruginibacter sp.]HMX79917.1 glycogen/starch synthase [Ferruginibacter sp.]HMZ99541.1 glycogen/starch synthase [Ferruginibacter sp.]